MMSKRENISGKIRENFRSRIEAKAERKMETRREKERNIWFGLGMFGLVGWTVAIPTLVGVALGIWIDRKWPSRFSWSLSLLFLGVVVGCINAWHWVKREGREGSEWRSRTRRR
jgi:ATP synthase protein I